MYLKKIGTTVFVILILHICNVTLISQNYLEREDLWVKSKMSEMTLDQKIGQLFIIRAFSKQDILEQKVIENYIKKYEVGGLCFFQGSPIEQVRLVNLYQQVSVIPLFIGIDAEWGLGMRFPKEAISFPKQLMLGAIEDNNLIYEMGREIGRQCKLAGVNINFAPSLDINSNPNNPVIYDRSFGENPQKVTSKGYMYMRALEDEGVMACIKHFPGHGDTNADSHYELPTLNHNMDRLEAVELYPFRRIASQGVSALMVGHLHVPTLDNQLSKPTTLSSKVIKKLLRDDIGFNGLIITDAMDMKGITKYYPSGIAEAEAFLAGNDILLLPENLPLAIEKMKSYIETGKITEARLNESVERILRAKYKIGLNYAPTHSLDNLESQLNNNQALAIKHKLVEASITLVEDKTNLIPIKEVESVTFATLSINVSKKSVFQDRCQSYVDHTDLQLMPGQLSAQKQRILQKLCEHQKVIVSIHTSGKLNDFSRDLGDEMITFLKEAQSKTDLIIVLFGNPYLLKKLDFVDHILLAYDNENITQDVAAQALFGSISIQGKLPVTIHKKWNEGSGLNRASLLRLGYSIPEVVGLNSDTLLQIDSIMSQMIATNAAPGGQVLIAKDGKIIMQKAFGNLSYNGPKVDNETIYDIASITKILATTLSAMHLVDSRRLDINKPINYYLCGIDTTDKAALIIKDVLSHHARLLSWIGFYEKTTLPKKNFGYNPIYYNNILKDDFTIPVAKNMFMRNDYKDSIFQFIWESKLRDYDNYKYSDLGFLILQKIIEAQSNQALDAYCSQNFYSLLGLRSTTFKPLSQHMVSKIAPTEIDQYFRNQILQGHVHDMTAAMLGGVAGHAGLFSNTHDMAVLMQMLLNKGSYGGRTYIHPKTVELFTTRHPKSSRRGLGFDLKELDPNKKPNISKLADDSTFGHTGFTGTGAWVDPKHKIVYIFCSNRTFPDRHNDSFNRREYRNKVQSVIYKAMKGLQLHRV